MNVTSVGSVYAAGTPIAIERQFLNSLSSVRLDYLADSWFLLL